MHLQRLFKPNKQRWFYQRPMSCHLEAPANKVIEMPRKLNTWISIFGDRRTAIYRERGVRVRSGLDGFGFGFPQISLISMSMDTAQCWSRVDRIADETLFLLMIQCFHCCFYSDLLAGCTGSHLIGFRRKNGQGGTTI